MDDVRSGLYWMAGVMTYQVAETLTILYFSLILLIKQYHKYNNVQNKWVVILLSILIGGTNEIVLALTLLITAIMISYYFAANKTVDRFYVLTFMAVATGSCCGLFAPGNLVRMKDYDTHKDIFLIAGNAFKSSLASMEVWITSPLTLILMIMVLLAVVSRPQLKAAFGSIKILYSTCTLLFLIFASFFIPYWSTGMYPQNRVLNMIYFFFLVGWMINLAVIFAHLGEPALAFGKKVSIKRWGFVAGAYMIVLFSLQTSNFVLVTKDLLDGESFRYSAEMQKIQSQLINSADDDCTVEDVKSAPPSLFFYFIGPDAQSWINRSYAAYFRKKSVCLSKGKKVS